MVPLPKRCQDPKLSADTVFNLVSCLICYAALTDSERKKARDDSDRRQSAVEEGVNKQLDEYPEELRGMLMMGGGM